jgi:hypothetical protein
VDTLLDAIDDFMSGDRTLDELGNDEEVNAASDRMDEFEEANCGPDPDGEGQ